MSRLDDIIPLRRSYVQTMVERISELEAEIERLQAAGDEMADAATRQQWSRLDVAVAAWQEARRG